MLKPLPRPPFKFIFTDPQDPSTGLPTQQFFEFLDSLQAVVNNLQAVLNTFAPGGGLLWSAYTPTVTGSTGGSPTVTNNSSRFVQIGKIVFYKVDITITAISGATGTTQFTLPVTATTPGYISYGREAVNTGFQLQGAPASSTVVQIFKYDDTAMLNLNDRYIINGTYEAV